MTCTNNSSISYYSGNK